MSSRVALIDFINYYVYQVYVYCTWKNGFDKLSKNLAGYRS